MKQHAQTLDLVLNQAFNGKGIRHGGNTIPFNQQPWLTYAKSYGMGFLAGQANKKLEEAFTVHHGQDRINEMLGAITYLCMADMFSSRSYDQWQCNYMLDDYISKLSAYEGLESERLAYMQHTKYIYGPAGLVQEAVACIRMGTYRAAIEYVCTVIELYQDEELADVVDNELPFAGTRPRRK